MFFFMRKRKRYYSNRKHVLDAFTRNANCKGENIFDSTLCMETVSAPTQVK